MMDRLHMFWKRVVNVLEPAGDWVALLPIRLLMAYEFGKAGLMKFKASDTLWGEPRQVRVDGCFASGQASEQGAARHVLQHSPRSEPSARIQFR